MWNPEVLPAKKMIIVWCNPIYPFIELVRAPILGKSPSFMIVGASITLTIIAAFVAFKLFARYRARIIYWL
jgi:ABC-type polysaccharide/polyol phosphate export permease